MSQIESSHRLAAHARAADPDRYVCALFMPPRQRATMLALILFNAEIARVRETVSEPMLGQIRLQWWREAIDEIYRGGGRRHEVADALAAAVRAHGLTRSYFDRLIDARERDLDDAAPESMAALETYAEESAAPLVSLALEVAGADAVVHSDVARHSGIAWALTGVMRALPHFTAQGRDMLPRDMLDGGGLDGGGAERRDVASAVAQVADVARRHVREARKLRRGLQAAAKRATLQAVLADAYLRRLKACGHDPYHANTAIGPLRRQLLLSRAAFFGIS